MMRDSKWVFSNSILFGENNPSWSALFSRDAGNNASPQREELGFSSSVSPWELPQVTPGHGWSRLTMAGPPIPASTGVTPSKC